MCVYCSVALNFHLQYYSVVFPLQWTLTKADTFGIKFGVRLRESFIIVNQGCLTYGPQANVRPATRFYVARQLVYNEPTGTTVISVRQRFGDVFVKV